MERNNNNNNNSGNPDCGCTKEELLELVRAIKFAKPDASMRVVHREIVEELSKQDGFAFLEDVKPSDVKRVWKKAQTAHEDEHAQQQQSEVWKLYTVGNASVKTLAKEYSRAAAAAKAAADQKEEQCEYVHVFLEVPLDRSGSRPHQALINFHDNKVAKKKNKKKKQQQQQQHARGEIVKIQVADGDAKYPMLLYNADRTAKTFIHPDPEDDGFDRIRDWIAQNGHGGALGVAGGKKAYFYARRTVQKEGADVISIDVTGLAPPQSW